ncbi:hypothetical protein ES703_27711 [subsurface metagenome]
MVSGKAPAGVLAKHAHGPLLYFIILYKSVDYALQGRCAKREYHNVDLQRAIKKNPDGKAIYEGLNIRLFFGQQLSTTGVCAKTRFSKINICIYFI